MFAWTRKVCTYACVVAAGASIALVPQASALGSSGSSFLGSSSNTTSTPTLWSYNSTYYAIPYNKMTIPSTNRTSGLRPGTLISTNDRSSGNASIASVAVFLKDDDNNIYALTTSRVFSVAEVPVYMPATSRVAGGDVQIGKVAYTTSGDDGRTATSKNKLNYALVKLDNFISNSLSTTLTDNTSMSNADNFNPFFSSGTNSDFDPATTDRALYVGDDLDVKDWGGSTAGWQSIGSVASVTSSTSADGTGRKHICSLAAGTGLNCGISIPLNITGAVDSSKWVFLRYVVDSDATSTDPLVTFDNTITSAKGEKISSLNFDYGGVIYSADATGLHPVAMVDLFDQSGHIIGGPSLSYIIDDAKATFGLNLSLVSTQTEVPLLFNASSASSSSTSSTSSTTTASTSTLNQATASVEPSGVHS